MRAHSPTLRALRVVRPLGMLAGAAAHAQPFGPLQQEARPFVRASEARAMGDAVAAVPDPETAFFYNPAHLAYLPRPYRVTVAGLGAGLSSGVSDKYAYWREELRPATNEGLDVIRETDYPRLEALYHGALAVGRRQDVARATAYGPAVQARLSMGDWDGAVGGGLFGTGAARLRFSDGGAGLPYLDAYGQADVIVPVTAAARIPRTPLAFGLTAALTHRRLTAKGALVETLDEDRAHLYVLSGTTLALDAGLHAADVLPGLDLGGAVYGLLGGGFRYRYRGQRIDLTGNGGDDDAAEIEALEARFNSRRGHPTWRLGVAYRVPLPAEGTPALDSVTLAADYVSASTSEFEQPIEAHLRAGIRVAVTRVLSLRTGIRQGYLSFGTTLVVPGVELDYAYFGIEDGRVPGQLGRYNHHLRLRFGLF
ncbi:MAG: hypothetical protein R3181_14075 [Rubricoccaceae bacterium]|nr:hypothetical protein [Rubricoccaceae bacterium]